MQRGAKRWEHVAEPGDLLSDIGGIDAGHVHAEVERVGAGAGSHVGETRGDIAGLVAANELVAAPVRLRGLRAVAAVHVDLVVEALTRWLAEPRATDEHARAGAAGFAERVGQLATARRRRQRVEQDPDAQARRAAPR